MTPTSLAVATDDANDVRVLRITGDLDERAAAGLLSHAQAFASSWSSP
jgi:hypothetical protein